MTRGFASRLVRSAGAAALTCIVATAARAQSVEPISMAPAPAETRVVFFDVQSASLGAVAKTIVLSAVDFGGAFAREADRDCRLCGGR